MSTFEVQHAAQAGIARAISALELDRALEQGRVDFGFEQHVHGAIGEYAVSRALDRCWRPAVGWLDTETGDVAGWQVKATTLPHGSLIVRPHDPVGFDYVLAVLRRDRDGLEVLLVGWRPGREAKQPRFWRERDPARGVHAAAHFVPQGELYPFATFTSS